MSKCICNPCQNEATTAAVCDFHMSHPSDVMPTATTTPPDQESAPMKNWDVLVKIKEPKLSAILYVTAQDEEGAYKRVKEILLADNPSLEFREIRPLPGLAPEGAIYDFDGRGGLKL